MYKHKRKLFIHPNHQPTHQVGAIVPALLAAISQPEKHAKGALDTLLETVFVNTIDCPSLALIMPVVQRGLRDRSGDVKKRSARIMGNLCSLLNDPRDMAPYVQLLLPDLQKALVDPLPEGACVRGAGAGAGPKDVYMRVKL